MSNSAISFWAGLAWAMAIVNAVASIIVMIAFGVAEIDAGGIVPDRQTVVVWPVILGCIASAIYGLLFAVLMSVARIAAVNSRTTLELTIKPESD